MKAACWTALLLGVTAYVVVVHHYSSALQKDAEREKDLTRKLQAWANHYPNSRQDMTDAQKGASETAPHVRAVADLLTADSENYNAALSKMKSPA